MLHLFPPIQVSSSMTTKPLKKQTKKNHTRLVLLGNLKRMCSFWQNNRRPSAK